MGSQIGSGAGGILGALIGSAIAPGIGTTIGGMAGSMAGGLIGSFLGGSRKPMIADVQTGNASYGNPIPILYGTARLGGTMIWQSQVTISHSTVGKGGGVPTNHMHQSAAFAFCEGTAILAKIWLDGVLFWDATDPSHERTKHTFTFRAYPGDEEQLADPLIAAWVRDNADVGAACPAYRGLAYLCFEGPDLINYGNRFPVVTAQWTTNGTTGVYVQPLVPTVGDVTAWHSSSVQFGMAADWTSGKVYAVAALDGTVRAYSMATGTEVASIAAADYDPTHATPEFTYSTVVAVGEGSDFVYVANTLLPASTSYYIQALDRNTLRPAAPPTTMTNEPYWFISNVPGQVGQLTVQRIVTPLGTFEFLVGVGGYGNVFLCTVLGGGDIELPVWTPMHFENLAPYTTICSGDDDILDDGSIRIYVLHSSFYGDGGVYVYRFRTDGTVLIGEPGLVGILLPSTFGFTDGTPSENNFFPSMGWFDASDGGLICQLRDLGSNVPGDFVVKIDCDKLAIGEDPVIWQNIVPQSENAGDTNKMSATNISSGTLAFPLGDTFTLMDVATGEYTTVTNTSGVTAGGTAVWGYDAAREALLVEGTAGPKVVYLHKVAVDEQSVGEIIADLCSKVGMTADMVDVTAVTATTVGYALRDHTSAGAAILDLCRTYQIDMVESDYTLKFVPRGLASVVTITQADLVSTNTDDTAAFWTAKSAQEQEMPLSIVVKYADPALDFQPGAAYAARTAQPVPTVFSKRRTVVDLPVVATNAEARHIAEQWLYTMWAERFTYETSLAAKYLWLDPTDNITVVLDDGTTNTVRIEKMEIGADLSMQLGLAAEDRTTYVVSNSPGVTYGVAPQTITLPVYADLLLFDVPLLRDADAAPTAGGRVYFAAGSSAPATFRGAVAYHSIDTATWPAVGSVAGAATWGRATTALGDAPNPFATDYLNTVTVSLTAIAPPVSCSVLELMSGANPMLIGSEIIQFQTVTDNTDGTYTLSNLLRGQRGTDWATATHTAGEVAIALDPTTIGGGVFTLSEINQSEYWKLAQPGDALAALTSRPWTYRGYDLMPYAPVQVTGVYSSSDIHLTWSRRTRLGGLLADGTDTVPLGETTEAYDVEIIDTDGVTVVRTYAALTTPALTYPDASIVADFGSPPAYLWVRVFQLSSVVGRGFSRHWYLDLVSGMAVADAGDIPA